MYSVTFPFLSTKYFLPFWSFSVIVTIYPSVPSSFVPGVTLYFPEVKYFPNSVSKFSCAISPPLLLANAPVADNSTFSLSSAISVCSFASLAFVNIPC